MQKDPKLPTQKIHHDRKCQHQHEDEIFVDGKVADDERTQRCAGHEGNTGHQEKQQHLAPGCMTAGLEHPCAVGQVGHGVGGKKRDDIGKKKVPAARRGDLADVCRQQRLVEQSKSEHVHAGRQRSRQAVLEKLHADAGLVGEESFDFVQRFLQLSVLS